MGTKELAFYRGLCAGIALTYLCTGKFVLCGITLTSWGLVELGLKKLCK